VHHKRSSCCRTGDDLAMISGHFMNILSELTIPTWHAKNTAGDTNLICSASRVHPGVRSP